MSPPPVGSRNDVPTILLNDPGPRIIPTNLNPTLSCPGDAPNRAGDVGKRDGLLGIEMSKMQGGEGVCGS